MPTFFAWAPTDWHEAMQGHRFSLAFEAEPDEGAARALAATVDEVLADGTASLCGPYARAGRVFCFQARGYGVTHLPRVRQFVQRLHAKVPVADAVFHDIREGARGEGTPVAGPKGLGFRPVDDALGKAAAWPAFDEELSRLFRQRAEARQRAANQAAAKALDAALAKQKKDAKICFERIDGEVLGEQQPPSREELGVALPAVLGASYRSDGRAVAIHAGIAAAVVDLQAKAVRWVPRPPGELRAVAYLADDRVAMHVGQELLVIDADDRIVASRPQKVAVRLLTVADGHGLCAAEYGTLQVLSADLKPVVALKVGAKTVATHGDTLEVGSPAGNLRATGLDTLRGKKSREPKPKDVPLLRFEALDAAPARPARTDAETVASVEAALGKCDWVFGADDGVAVAVVKALAMWLKQGAKGVWASVHFSGLGVVERAFYLRGPNVLLAVVQGRARVLTYVGPLELVAHPHKGMVLPGELKDLGSLAMELDDAFDVGDDVVLAGSWGALRVSGWRPMA